MHFRGLDQNVKDQLFLHPPKPIDRTERDQVALALGATLYIPGSRPTIAHDLCRLACTDLVSAVICLEDAISDDQLAAVERNVVVQLRRAVQMEREAAAENTQDAWCLPLIFVRVRSLRQLVNLVTRLGPDCSALSGFVLPKFEPEPGAVLLAEIRSISQTLGRPLWAMPVLETPRYLYAESRVPALLDTVDQLKAFPDQILALRFGATDLMSTFAVRRHPHLSLHDVFPIAAALAEVINVMSRPENGFVVTGSVWEHYGDDPGAQTKTRPSTFGPEYDAYLRDIRGGLDGLIREIVLDRAAGLLGKSVIHPRHIRPVHAVSVVRHEDYADAVDILGHPRHGAVASPYGNKMNESKPHAAWARRTWELARIFGVSAAHVTLSDLLQAGAQHGR